MEVSSQVVTRHVTCHVSRVASLWWSCWRARYRGRWGSRRGLGRSRPRPRRQIRRLPQHGKYLNPWIPRWWIEASEAGRAGLIKLSMIFRGKQYSETTTVYLRYFLNRCFHSAANIGTPIGNLGSKDPWNHPSMKIYVPILGWKYHQKCTIFDKQLIKKNCKNYRKTSLTPLWAELHWGL